MYDQLTLKQVLAEPNTLEDLHIPDSIVLDIIFRLLYNEGNLTLSRFTEVLKIPKAIIDDILLWMQKEHIVEVSKGSLELGRLAHVYTLTQAGEQRAISAMGRSQYVGPVPVSIPYYNQGIELQTRKPPRISGGQIKDSLKHLVLPDKFDRLVGPAINTSASLFLYGPPGNGKTTIALAVGGLISGSDPIWIPYALTAGGQIIQIFDRLVHNQIPVEKGKTVEFGRIDQRWGLFERPAVIAGGELKMDSLDLRYDPIAKTYEAPLQLKANGGMFLLDDFGRQQMSPTDLLNRWIVPLDRRIDFLRLQSGQTITVPFRELIIFSTNLDPKQLVDDAFLRRIHIKVKVDSPDEKLYYQIFLIECKQHNIAFEKDVFVHLLQTWYKKTGRTLQAVHPRDILGVIKSICEYDGSTPRLTPELIDEACLCYFVD